MSVKSLRIRAELFLLLLSCATPALAQAVFSVGMSPQTVSDIGYAEQAGDISLSVISGTTVAGPLVITYSAPIANNAASEILITGRGGLSVIAATPILDRGENSITINIPAGGSFQDQIIISGVRVAVAGLGLTSVNAMISTPTDDSNLIVAGQTNPLVIGSILEPFSVAQGIAPFLSYENGEPVNENTLFQITELFPNAFSDTVGIGGQTHPSRIRITPFPPLPEGAELTFESTAIAQTGATLTTLSGNSEIVPRADGSTDVIFEFSSVSGSGGVNEIFELNVSLTKAPRSGAGIIQFQAALVPIGAASTDIPRYAERLVPDAEELSSGSTELIFPFREKDEATYTGVALTNPRSFPVKATLAAYSANGAMITGAGIDNPVTITLVRNGQFAKTASEIFGEGFNASSAGTIGVSANAEIKGFYILGDISGPKFDGSNAEISSSEFWYMPMVFGEGVAFFNLLEIYNPGESEADVDLELFDASGIQIATGSGSIAPGGVLLRDVNEVFVIDRSSFQGGYIKARSESEFVFRNNFGNALESNILSAQLPSQATSLYIPHFATGGQYSTVLDLTNTNASITAKLRLTLLNNEGDPIAVAGNPVIVEIAPKAKLSRKIAELYPSLGPELVTGSIRADVGPYYGPLALSPGLIGSIRFSASDGSASAALSVLPGSAMDCVYSQLAEGAGYYTGIALLNANDRAAAFTLDVYAESGVLMGSYTSSLEPYARAAGLISQFVPAAEGKAGGYFRIRSNAPLASIALFGTTDVRSLSAIAPQILK